MSIEIKRVSIPTYVMGPDSPYPSFHWRAWHGHYPFSTQLDLSTEKRPVEHRIVVLENDYVRAEVLPDMGGRLYRLYDKVARQETFMVPPSVKFQNIALRGAWIAGGIEFNFGYRSHTAVTCSPVSWATRKDDDGGACVWVGTVIRPMESRWAVRIGLKPERSALDLRIFTMGPLVLPGMMYWWTNATVEVGPESRFYYWGTYAGDYASHSWPWTDGMDFSWYRNRLFGADMFLMEPQRDYLGFYDFQRQHGLAQTADRFHSPGQKYFSWGSDERGRYWDFLLSDSGQTYCEIQRGRLPSQGRTHGFSGTQGDLVISVNREGPDAAVIRLLSAIPRKGVRLEAFAESGSLGVWETGPMTPGRPLSHRLALGRGQSVRRALVTDPAGSVVMDWHEFDLSTEDWYKYRPGFDEAKASLEELFAEAERRRFALWPNGTDNAARMYRKILGVDPGHSGALGGLAEIEYYAGQFAKAEELLRQALQRRAMDPSLLTLRGWTLLALSRHAEAVEAFSIATRYEPGRRNGLVGLIWTMLRTGNLPAAGRISEQLMALYPADRWSRWLRTIVLRKTGRTKEAAQLVRGLLADDPIWYRANAEAAMLGVPTGLAAGERTIADDSVIAATDYLLLGLWDDAVAILQHEDSDEPFSPAVRLAHLAHAQHGLGDKAGAKATLRKLARSPLEQATPWTTAAIGILKELAAAYPDQAMIHFLLGNVLSSRRRLDEAMPEWYQAAKLGLEHTVVYRNLAAAADHLGEKKKALRLYRKAWKLSGANLYLFNEFDRLLAGMGLHQERNRLYGELPQRVRGRSIVALRRVPQLLDLQRYDEALRELATRTFLSGETHERVVRGQFLEALVAKAMQLMDQRRFGQALEVLQQGLTYPRNHNAGRVNYRPEESIINYFLGLAHEAAGDEEAARRHWTAAAQEQHSEGELTQAYEMMAWVALGNRARAMSIAHDFEQFARGERTPAGHWGWFDGPGICKLGHGLGQLAKGWPDQAMAVWRQALAEEPGGRWLRPHVNMPAWLLERMCRRVTGPAEKADARPRG
ncbi:MAG: hypothetical protein AMJ81_04150 [Phycisphaerae bacterium SM23_33]|nr:MAG: hypothetical protein AMJ81_04150 [Phycisphaerae bacterium SM23_33]